MRLFVAVDLNESAREAIAMLQSRIVKQLKDQMASLRLVRPEQMHITLAFIGEVVPQEADLIVRSVEQPAGMPAFRIALSGIEVFRAHGKPQALFLDVSEGVKPLAALQDEIASRLETCHVPRERQPFHPHVTLARWRRSGSSHRRATLPGPRLTLDRSIHIEVREAALYQSRISSNGPAYTRLAAMRLT